MMEYEPRYLAGVLFFNRGDYFEAHEVWEALWHDLAGPERRFIQGLIQAAVGLCHFGNGNRRGATKLYHSSRDYLQPYLAGFWGLDVQRFLNEHAETHQGLLNTDRTPTTPELNLDLAPEIVLNPLPTAWPVPEALLPEED